MKRLILIGATLAVVIATAFVYTHSERAVPQVISVVNVTAKGMVIDAMRSLASTSAFTFTGRDYPGLGFFVDSINGKKNADGMYWILYVNGVLATAGVSALSVSAGDTIEWKYEKSY